MGSFRDIAVTPFSGYQNDPFTRRVIWQSICHRVRIALNLWPGDAEREAVYTKVLVRAVEVLGSKSAAHDWIATPHGALRMRTPLSKFVRETGVAEVMAVLKALEDENNRFRAEFEKTNRIE
jgi:uncharacterized protein (DUF2384 family)